jgi:aspartyl-tRNA(Asn)/glutamyl-tRNA(Gln) amidotransferase subunit C
MDTLNKDNLKALCKLCRIEFSDKDLDPFLEDLQSILTHIDSIREVDTEGVPACNHILDTVQSVMREDKTEQTLPRNTFLANSPSHVGGMIRVPPVIKPEQ